jgi:hypothetical protein
MNHTIIPIRISLINVANEKNLSDSTSEPVLLEPRLLSDTSRDISGIFIPLNVCCALSFISDNTFDLEFIDFCIFDIRPDFSILDAGDNPLFTLSLFVGEIIFVNLKVGRDILLCSLIYTVYTVYL